jgi:CRISPR/Cas system CSM-associated protein Csm2 small subunit
MGIFDQGISTIKDQTKFSLRRFAGLLSGIAIAYHRYVGRAEV